MKRQKTLRPLGRRVCQHSIDIGHGHAFDMLEHTHTDEELSENHNTTDASRWRRVRIEINIDTTIGICYN